MSYILEALKKAQAERQLGSAPTLNAVPVGAAPAAIARKRRLPWLAACGVALALAGAFAAWRMQTPAPAPQPAAVVVVAPPPVVPPAPPPMAVMPPSAPAPQPAPVVVKAPAPKPAPAAVNAPAPVEEKLPSLRELPDSIRGTIPQVAFGGYMYSANPADRLLLVDKALRHEGEEVAPGLVLEKLRPKAAVMNYRGTRYLVPY